MHSDRRLTTGDIMRYCCVSRATALKWIKSDKLSAYLHPDGQYRITQDALIDFLKTYNMPLNKELLEGMSEQDKDMAGVEIRKYGNSVRI
jgi:hypothetical protein